MHDTVQTILKTCIVPNVIVFGLFACVDPIADTDTSAKPIALSPVRVEADAVLRDQYYPVFDSVESIGQGDGHYIVSVRLQDESLKHASASKSEASKRRGGFRLTVRDSEAEIIAADAEGIVNGLTTFEREARAGSISVGEIVEQPVHSSRALHFVLRGLDEQELRKLVALARRARMNLIIASITDAVRFETLSQVARADALTATEFENFVRYARANGLEVVPEVKLLTHQEKFLKNHYPEVMFNSRTYDPNSEIVKDFVSDYLEEMIERVNPIAVHIGHDEVRQADSVGKPNGLRPGERPLPAALYLQSIRSLYAYLKRQEIETWMWGDMLVTARELPDMDARALHGTPDYRAIRDLLPHDIVICDWQYYETKNFRSATIFSNLGFRVMGATWKRSRNIHAFSRHIAELQNGVGMIATTWFEVQQGNWETVERTVAESGEAFWYGR